MSSSFCLADESHSPTSLNEMQIAAGLWHLPPGHSQKRCPIMLRQAADMYTA